jgi:hypothetical protein
MPYMPLVTNAAGTRNGSGLVPARRKVITAITGNANPSARDRMPSRFHGLGIISGCGSPKCSSTITSNETNK